MVIQNIEISGCVEALNGYRCVCKMDTLVFYKISQNAAGKSIFEEYESQHVLCSKELGFLCRTAC